MAVGNEHFHDDVAELDVHYGCHRFFLWPQKTGAEADAQITNGHKILRRVVGNPTQMPNDHFEHPIMRLRKLVDVEVDVVDALLEIGDLGGVDEVVVEVERHQRLGQVS